MAKPTAPERPKALDTLVAIIDLVIPHRYPDRDPSLADVARLTSAASRVLRFHDLDERIETENRATLQIAKKLQLVS
jgi:hypothetical protein